MDKQWLLVIMDTSKGDTQIRQRFKAKDHAVNAFGRLRFHYPQRFLLILFNDVSGDILKIGFGISLKERLD